MSNNLRKVFGNSRSALGATRNAQAIAQASKSNCAFIYEKENFDR